MKIWRVFALVFSGHPPVFVGITTDDLQPALAEIKQRETYAQGSLLGEVIRRFGEDELVIVLLDECDDRFRAEKKKFYWVRQFKTNMEGRGGANFGEEIPLSQYQILRESSDRNGGRVVVIADDLGVAAGYIKTLMTKYRIPVRGTPRGRPTKYTKEIVRAALKKHHGSLEHAAKELGLSAGTRYIYQLAVRFGIPYKEMQKRNPSRPEKKK